MAKRKKYVLTEEQRQKLMQELEVLGKQIDEIFEEADRYVQAILDSVGNKPVIRNPNIKKHPSYKMFEIAGFFDPNPSFWEIKPDDDPKVKAMKDARKRTFIFECLMTPEEGDEYERILAKAERLQRRHRAIRLMLDGVPPEEAEEIARQEFAEDQDEGPDAVLFA